MRISKFIGVRFSRLIVVERGPNIKFPSGQTQTSWECKCDCGKTTFVTTSKLQSAHTKSCGCLREEFDGHRTHGLTRTKEYFAWHNAKRRCGTSSNCQYHNYGGRGIRMCEEWKHSFAAFFAHMGKCPPKNSLDRIDSDGHYEPGNCRWATNIQQAYNRRTSKRGEFTPAERRKVKKLIQAGKSLRYIGLRFNVSHTTIMRMVV